jgi:hypothetical protein
MVKIQLLGNIYMDTPKCLCCICFISWDRPIFKEGIGPSIICIDPGVADPGPRADTTTVNADAGARRHASDDDDGDGGASIAADMLEDPLNDYF